jgi:ketosteroid isomerase-like protein
MSLKTRAWIKPRETSHAVWGEVMTDMGKVAKEFKGGFDSEKAAGKSHTTRDEPVNRGQIVERLAPDSHAFLPGPWFMGGHHHGEEAVKKMWETAYIIWPGSGTTLFRHYRFVGEDTILGEWWSRNHVWNGNPCQNSGVGRLRFRGDRLINHHEITDSEYFEEVHNGWQDQVPPELGKHLPRWHDRKPPYYPDPANNDWNFDHSPTDGRNQAPASMRERLARAIEWWRDPRSGDDNIFAENVDIFFQGKQWPLGGHHYGQAGLARLREVMGVLWPGPDRVVRTNFWANDDERIAVEWFRTAKTWNGQEFREGGYTVWDWKGDRVAAVRTYLDTSLHAQLTQGWREKVDARIGIGLPNWKEPPQIRYPITNAHE